ncbi:MAG: polysaccharide biosynthesis/export family protein [Victivallales bacterium]|nr:polysaccharide biosynthesis/export family protein [Victivallales bacterium]
MKHFFAVLAIVGWLFSPLAAQTQNSSSALRPGDVLNISVFRMNELSQEVQVGEDGTFFFPLCGYIQAAGLTPKEVAASLSKVLGGEQISDPQVSIFVSHWARRTVYLLGEVQTSMSLELPTYGSMTALQAISAAGGFTESADLNNVAVLRHAAEDKTEIQRFKLDVSALVSRKSGGDEFILQPEDTIIVPKAPPVFIAGEVRNTGSWFIDTQRPPLCSEFITRVGGLLDKADARDILIVRQGSDGVRMRLPVSLWLTGPGEYENDITIAPGDYILVNSAREIYVLGEVEKPGPLVVGPNKSITASQAIALAGGYTKLAKKSGVALIRGSEVTTLNLKNIYNSSEKLDQDVELQNGDILFVPESMW